MCARCHAEYTLVEGKDANECKLRTSGNYCPADRSFKLPSGLCEAKCSEYDMVPTYKAKENV